MEKEKPTDNTDKKKLRRESLEKRAGLSEKEREEKSFFIGRLLQTDIWYHNAARILCYASFRDEVSTEAMIRHALKQGKEVYCPRVYQEGEQIVFGDFSKDHKAQMDFWRIRSLNDLRPGFRGIPEPACTPTPWDWEKIQKQRDAGWIIDPAKFSIKDSQNTIMLLPGAAFDRQGNRIGYGAGYYDVYLKRFSHRPRLMGLCFLIQLLDTIPSEEQDVPVEKIITERGILEIGKGKGR